MRQPIVSLAVVLTIAAGVVASAHAGTSDSMQHVWVHYDYMAGFDATDGRYVSFEPDPAAIRLVVDAFKRHGVVLHIDPQHNAVPWHEVIVPDFVPLQASFFSPSCTGPDAVRYSTLKAQYFQAPDNHPWHYVVFADSAFSPEDGTLVANCGRLPDCSCFPTPGSTGFAALPGYDFVVTLGLYADVAGDCWSDYATFASLPCFPVADYALAATFMHELGHNLGLQHGGNTGVNYKPNYVSVMNYAYQLSAIETTSTTTPSGYSFRVDYSDETLPTLAEFNLDEAAGVGSVLHPDDLVFWWDFAQGGGFNALASGPIDWNQDGDTTDTGLHLDINGDGDPPNGLGSVLTGFNDWDEVHQYLATEDAHPKHAQVGTP